ncbi:MAG: hypothetical protein K2L15_03495, partial [Eubacteriales bacterium]|nr:hypothetical protein [Eubacteriales bacterium]
MKKLTICIISVLAIYSLFISINYNKLKLENKSLDSQNFNLRNILDREKNFKEKGYYLTEYGEIYIIDEDRFIDTFNLNSIFDIEDNLKLKIINNPIDRYEGITDKIQEATTTGGILSAIEEINDLWLKEIDYSLEQLKNYLSEEEYNNLLEVQKEWEDYIVDEYRYYLETFDYSGYARINFFSIYKSKVRQRAIDLIDYLS